MGKLDLEANEATLRISQEEEGYHKNVLCVFHYQSVFTRGPLCAASLFGVARARTSPPLIPEVSTVIQNNQSEAIYLKVNRHPASLRLHSQVSPNCPLRPHKCQNDLCVFCFRVGNPLSSSCRPPQVKCSEVATCLLSPCSCVRVCWGGCPCTVSANIMSLLLACL